MHVCVLSHLSCIWLFVTPLTAAHQIPLSMGFLRQEYWSGLPFPTPGDLLWPRDRIWISYIAGRFLEWMCPCLPTCSQTEIRSGCFQFLEINNEAAINIDIQTFVQAFFSYLWFVFSISELFFQRIHFKKFLIIFWIVLLVLYLRTLPKGDTNLFSCFLYIFYTHFYSFIFYI